MDEENAVQQARDVVAAALCDAMSIDNGGLSVAAVTIKAYDSTIDLKLNDRSRWLVTIARKVD